MKLSWSWLGELVDLDGITPAEAAERLTFHTAEIEHVTPVGAALPGVVTARTLSVRPHPDADRLRLVTVDPGDGTTPEVVCGAPNVAEGQIVAYAPVGTTLPGGAGGPVTLTPRKIRGVESRGMICAEDELGLGDDHDGILVLPPDTPVGTPISEVVATEDTVLELSNIAITHRPDLWGHQGFARELAALFGRPLKLSPRAELEADGEPFPVRVEAEADCARYVGAVIEGLSNGPSPLAWRRRLTVLGQRSIDRLVDLTNLVLLETGQPLHAFDLAALRGGTISVRRAQSGEAFTALDGSTPSLQGDDLVIADGEGAVALAGVMGGEASGVGPDTTAVLLESAWFAPGVIRATAARLGWRTEASSRFEKGLDPEGTIDAAARFLALARTVLPEARLARTVSDVRTQPAVARTVRLPLALVKRRLGLRLPDATIRSKLSALGFRVDDLGSELDVHVPSWRAGSDIRLPEDLVEEVGRLVGYESVQPLAPLGTIEVRRPDARRRLERRLLPLFTLERGWNEVKTYSFHGDEEGAPLGLGGGQALKLAGLAEDRATWMATSALPRLLAIAARNRHTAPAAAFVDSTRVFAARATGLPAEVRVLAGIAYDEGDTTAAGAAVLHLAHDLRAVLARAGLPDVQLLQRDPRALAEGLPQPAWWHPGRRAELAARGVHLGSLGELAPRASAAQGFDGRVAGFEISLDSVREALDRPGPASYTPPLKFPVVPFDVAVVVPSEVPVDDVRALIEGASPEHVRDVACFDVYAGTGIADGHKSLAFRLELYDRERTLDGATADKLRASVTQALSSAGYTIRGA
ncbi:MAG: phenylalanine--tRNA ligase subunit beta [Planctomycetota bacterium]